MLHRNSCWVQIMGIGVLGMMLMAAKPAAAAGFPTATCRPGYIQAGPRLCISQFEQNATRFDEAMRLCRNQFGYVASYGDLYYLYINTGLDAAYNPNGKWLGPDLVGDDSALCGNRDVTFNGDADERNFEGTCSKFDARSYWCAHDRE